MNRIDADRELDALQDHVRRAAGVCRLVRWNTCTLAVCILTGALVVSLGSMVKAAREKSRILPMGSSLRVESEPPVAPIGRPPGGAERQGFVLFAYAGFAGALVAGWSAAAAMTWLYRRVRCRQLVRALQALPRDRAVEALAPFKDSACGDQRQVVAPLLRALNTAREVSPASPVPAAGNEISPAESGTS